MVDSVVHFWPGHVPRSERQTATRLVISRQSGNFFTFAISMQGRINADTIGAFEMHRGRLLRKCVRAEEVELEQAVFVRCALGTDNEDPTLVSPRSRYIIESAYFMTSSLLMACLMKMPSARPVLRVVISVISLFILPLGACMAA